MTYKSKRKIFVILLVIGLVLIITDIAMFVLTDFISTAIFTVLFSCGICFTTSGGLWLGSELYYKSKPEKGMKAFINNTDERNVAMTYKAAYILYFIMTYLLLATYFLFTLLKNSQASYVIVGLLLIYQAIFILLRLYYRTML